MRSLIALTCVICGTVVICHGTPLWSAPLFCLAALGVIARA